MKKLRLPLVLVLTLFDYMLVVGGSAAVDGRYKNSGGKKIQMSFVRAIDWAGTGLVGIGSEPFQIR